MTRKPDRSLPALASKARFAGAAALHSLRRAASRQPRGLVRVEYQGRLGNRLFQYSLGRILARGLDFTLAAEPLPGFPHTRWSGTPTPRAWGWQCPRQELRGHTVDPAGLLADRKPREILLRGYFEKYAYYREHKEAIRGWLECDTTRVEPPAPQDAVVHVRSGDIWQSPRGGKPSPIHAAMPVSYYHRILTAMEPRRVWVVTENPRDPVARRLQETWGASVTGGSPLEDFAFLLGARRIVLSVSTFAWWGAWLSRAEEIHLPLWGGWHPDTRGSATDLRVTDEKRYVVHELGPKSDWRGDAGDLERTLDA